MSRAQTCSQENLRGPAPSGPARSGAVPWGLASSANTSGPPWGGEGSGQNRRARVICRAAPWPLPAHLGPGHHQRWLPQVAPSGPPGVSRDRGPMVFCGNPCGPKGKGDSELRDGVGKGCRRKKGNPGELLARGSGPSSGSSWMGGSRWERGLGGPNRGGFTGRGHNQAGQGTRAAPSKPQLFVQRRAGAATSAPLDRCPRRAGGGAGSSSDALCTFERHTCGLYPKGFLSPNEQTLLHAFLTRRDETYHRPSGLSGLCHCQTSDKTSPGHSRTVGRPNLSTQQVTRSALHTEFSAFLEMVLLLPSHGNKNAQDIL